MEKAKAANRATRLADPLLMLTSGQGPRYHSQKQIHQAQQDRTEERRSESVNDESRYENRGDFQHDSVNYKPEYSKCDECQREGHDLEKESQSGIDETDH